MVGEQQHDQSFSTYRLCTYIGFQHRNHSLGNEDPKHVELDYLVRARPDKTLLSNDAVYQGRQWSMDFR